MNKSQEYFRNINKYPKEENCVKCGIPVLTFDGGLLDMIMNKRYNENYCNECKPPLIFFFKTNLLSQPIVEVEIPDNLMSGMEMICFYDLLAEKLRINVENIIIWGKTKEQEIQHQKKIGRKGMICPAEYIEEEHRTFSAYILTN